MSCALVEAVLHEALYPEGSALTEAVVNPDEPLLPGKITTDPAGQFAKATAKGQKVAGTS